MIEKDGVIMFTGGSSSGVAVACQALGQELGIIYMCGLTHSNDTTGKDKRRYGFRHFFNAYMSGRALGPVLAQERSEEHTSELQSLMRISYAVFCLKKKNNHKQRGLVTSKSEQIQKHS